MITIPGIADDPRARSDPEMPTAGVHPRSPATPRPRLLGGARFLVLINILSFVGLGALPIILGYKALVSLPCLGIILGGVLCVVGAAFLVAVFRFVSEDSAYLFRRNQRRPSLRTVFATLAFFVAIASLWFVALAYVVRSDDSSGTPSTPYQSTQRMVDLGNGYQVSEENISIYAQKNNVSRETAIQEYRDISDLKDAADKIKSNPKKYGVEN